LSKRAPDLDAISAAAEAAAAKQDQESESQRIQALEAKLAEIEPLLEQLQANSAIGPKLSEYIGDLRSEQVFFNRARYGVGGLALLTVFGVVGLLGLAIFHWDSPLLKASAGVVAAVVVGLVSSVVLLISGFVRGVFRSTVERHADGFLPPALEKAVEMVGKISGNRD
jgi:hypothetical protein